MDLGLNEVVEHQNINAAVASASSRPKKAFSPWLACTSLRTGLVPISSHHSHQNFQFDLSCLAVVRG